MPHEVIMPALGMAQDTGLLVNWLKRPGDAVKAGDALFEVETDKATMEVEAPADGFLTDVTADAGAEVPVGNVIAMVSKTAAGSGAAPDAEQAVSTDAVDFPVGAEIIMPALGMAQDSGVILAWHKAPGDAVMADDILFEVETDKATMEVEAGHGGYVAALLAEAGEDAPVGDVIAIISATKPATPLQRSLSGAAKPRAVTPDTTTQAPTLPKPLTADPVPVPVTTGGRFLASPKARRLALEQGLDLRRLVDAGHAQPFHVRDLEVLRAMPAKSASAAIGIGSRHLTAEVDASAFAVFCIWAAGETGRPPDRPTVLAGFAAAGMPGPTAVISVEAHGQRLLFPETESGPNLILRDLTGSPLVSVSLGVEDAPVLTLSGTDDRLTITLECAPDQLSAPEALNLITGMAGRLNEPLRHLL